MGKFVAAIYVSLAPISPLRMLFPHIIYPLHKGTHDGVEITPSRQGATLHKKDRVRADHHPYEVSLIVDFLTINRIRTSILFPAK